MCDIKTAVVNLTSFVAIKTYSHIYVGVIKLWLINFHYLLLIFNGHVIIIFTGVVLIAS